MDEAIKTHKTYVIFSALPKSIRMIITVPLLFIGFAIQFNYSIILGGIFILLASLLNIMHLATIKEHKSSTQNWERVTYDEINKVLEKMKAMKKWQGYSYNGRSLFVFIVSIFAIFILSPAIALLPRTGKIIALDFYLLFVPAFISGSRKVWIPADLQLKIDTLTKINTFSLMKSYPDLKTQPFLLIGKESSQSTFPLDTRLLIKFTKAPKDFIGTQIQASINKVGSNSYPYVYAVIIAKKSMNLEMNKAFSTDKNIIFEHQAQDEMDILVIRQFTTKTSGYHTNDKVISAIVQQALATSQQLLFSNKGR